MMSDVAERIDAKIEGLGDWRRETLGRPVSYTHLTLPTILRV